VPLQLTDSSLTETPHGDAPKRGLTFRRGLIRLWAILSVLWVLGRGAMYWPQTGFYWPPSVDLLNALIFNYEAGRFDRVPVALPQRQEGIHWETLTAVQQAVARYSAQQASAKCSIGQVGPLTLAELECRLQQLHSPEEFLYKLIPLTDLPLAEAQRFRSEWVAVSWQRFCQLLRGLLIVAVGVPLAVGIAGFLAYRAGRWIWAGFARSG